MVCTAQTTISNFRVAIYDLGTCKVSVKKGTFWNKIVKIMFSWIHFSWFHVYPFKLIWLSWKERFCFIVFINSSFPYIEINLQTQNSLLFPIFDIILHLILLSKAAVWDKHWCGQIRLHLNTSLFSFRARYKSKWICNIWWYLPSAL